MWPKSAYKNTERRVENAKELFTTHGMSKTKIYYVWYSMRKRCNCRTSKSYKYYGGMGIKVCNSWNKFENFLNDMGIPPDGFTLDRIDGKRDYSPENCRWASRKDQNNNKSNNRFITFRGETLSMSDWSRKLSIKESTLQMRINHYKWPLEKALTIPIKIGGTKINKHNAMWKILEIN